MAFITMIKPLGRAGCIKRDYRELQQVAFPLAHTWALTLHKSVCDIASVPLSQKTDYFNLLIRPQAVLFDFNNLSRAMCPILTTWKRLIEIQKCNPVMQALGSDLISGMTSFFPDVYVPLTDNHFFCDEDPQDSD